MCSIIKRSFSSPAMMIQLYTRFIRFYPTGVMYGFCEEWGLYLQKKALEMGEMEVLPAGTLCKDHFLGHRMWTNLK